MFMFSDSVDTREKGRFHQPDDGLLVPVYYLLIGNPYADVDTGLVGKIITTYPIGKIRRDILQGDEREVELGDTVAVFGEVDFLP